MGNQKTGNDQVCGECSYFTGEECNGYLNEGREKYVDSSACDDFCEREYRRDKDD